MVLTVFADVGKSARDLFSKHFKFNVVNFDFKSKTENDVDVHVACNNNSEDRVDAAADVTFKPADGISVKTKIDSDWIITNDVEISEKIKNVKHNIISSLDYKAGTKKLKLKSSLIQDYVTADLELDFASKYPNTIGSITVGDQGYIAGAQVTMDTNGFELKKHVYTVGYSSKDFQVHGHLTNHKDVECKLFQTHDNIEVGILLGWNGGLTSTNFGLAAMYKPNKNSFIKGRVDQNGKVGLAYGIKPNCGKLILTLNYFKLYYDDIWSYRLKFDDIFNADISLKLNFHLYFLSNHCFFLLLFMSLSLFRYSIGCCIGTQPLSWVKYGSLWGFF